MIPIDSEISLYMLRRLGGVGTPRLTLNAMPLAWLGPWYGSWPRMTTLTSSNACGGWGEGGAPADRQCATHHKLHGLVHLVGRWVHAFAAGAQGGVAVRACQNTRTVKHSLFAFAGHKLRQRTELGGQPRRRQHFHPRRMHQRFEFIRHCGWRR